MAIIAGVDEAGRGPLAGPVVAAAVILDGSIDGVTDSKLLTEKKRDILFETIKLEARYFGIGICDANEIDELNIHQATLVAMSRAVENLGIVPDKLLVDGIHAPNVSMPCECIIKGDLLEQCIGAASIIAKVTRDRIMKEWDERHPQYGFAKHKGYGTKQHKEALLTYGPLPIHRFSYAPVRQASELTEG